MGSSDMAYSDAEAPAFVCVDAAAAFGSFARLDGSLKTTCTSLSRASFDARYAFTLCASPLGTWTLTDLFALLSSGLADDVRIFVDDDDDDDDDTALCTLVIRLFRLLACFPAAESRFMFIISLLLSIQRAAAPFPPLSLCCFSLSHTQQRTRASFALLSEHLIAV